MTIADLKRLRAAFAFAAQRVYDSWHQDGDEGECEGEDLGRGGICDHIAEAMGAVINAAAGIDAAAGAEWTTFNSQVGSNHTWLFVKATDGLWSVDIPWWVYEQGGGYCWRKIPNVVFTTGDIEIRHESSDPEAFSEYEMDY